MKSVTVIVIVVGVMFLLGGCAWTEGAVDEVGEKIYEGFQGRGRIVPMETTRDGFGPFYE
ncbi:MAG: hypothetical protein NZL93_01270 [Chthoniobacterales bacterium]|nr:hypothetical protein [Chthoniobacterales bacterium]